jgi:dTDP-glucose 4,6-dehydratase
MRKLLVTGGAGFIGANFAHYWLNQHPHDRVVVLDALTYAGNRANLASLDSHPGLRFVHGNILDEALVKDLLDAEQLDTIVHFAAESHVDRSILGPDAFLETNVNGTHALLKAAKSVWLSGSLKGSHRFHHVSTDEVYGSLGPSDPPFTETTPYAPNSPYSASKAASDHLVRAYHHTYGLNVTTSNCSNNYGPYHFPEKLIPLTIVNILNGKALPIYGDGRNVRDWLHVTDHCRGIECILANGQVGEVYNLGGQGERENIQLVSQLCEIADAEFASDEKLTKTYPESPAARGAKSAELITYVKDRPGHDRRYAIDLSKANRELGYSPSVTLESGLTQVFRWYAHNREWWRAVMDGSYRQWLGVNYGER